MTFRNVVCVGLAFTLLMSEQVRATDVPQPSVDMLYELRGGQPGGSISFQTLRNSYLSASTTYFDPRNYGAVCDGNHHPISTSSFIQPTVSTKAALAAYTFASGTTPYAWINNAEWTPKVALSLVVPGASTNTTLYFESLVGVPSGASVSGTQVPSTTISSLSSGIPSTLTKTLNGTLTGTSQKSVVVTSGTGVVAGSYPVPQAGLSPDDWVTTLASNTITMKYGTTSTITTGTTLTFQPPASMVIGSGLTGAKPSRRSASATTSSNPYVYATWTLTDAMVAAAEMDWLGIQAAIEAATASPTGGTVLLPAGHCIMDNSTVAGSGLGWLIIHEDVGTLQFTKSVDLLGQGMVGTLLDWPTDLGTGRAAISFGVPYATWDNSLGRYGANTYYGFLGNFSIQGPNGWSMPSIGTPGSTRMIGLHAGARRQIDRFNAHGFYVGMTGEGVDHTEYGTIILTSNAIGLRMGPVNQYLSGNNLFRFLHLENNSVADIQLDKDAFWNQTNVLAFYCGQSPMCFRLEEGPQDSYSQPSGQNIQFSTFSSINAEGLGAGMIVDLNHGTNAVTAGDGGGEMHMQGNNWLQVSPGYDAGAQPAGTRFNYWIDGGAMFNTALDFIAGGLSTVSGQQAGIFIDYANAGTGGIRIQGDMTNVLYNYGSTPLLQLNSVPYGQTQYSIQLVQPNSWIGHPEIYASATGAAQGNTLCYTTSGSLGGADMGVQKCAGSSDIFAGINMTTATTAGLPTIVATRFCGSSQSENGAAEITIPTSGTATALHYGQTATGGTVTNAATPATGTTIGIIMKIPTAGQARMNIGGGALSGGACDF